MKSSVNHHRRWSVLTLTLLAGIMIIPNITRSGMTKTRLLKTPTPMMSTIIVTTTANTIAADGQCSLREAIINANNEAATHADCLAGSGADTIVLQASTTYTLDVRDNTEYGFNGLPAITSAITIEGNGATITRSGSASTFRLFYVANTGNLTLRNTTLSNGYAKGGDGGAALSGGGGGGAGLGGAILNRGVLSIANSTLSSNRAQGGKGGNGDGVNGNSTAGGGGGGLGGNGGASSFSGGGGGGGGFGGNGGNTLCASGSTSKGGGGGGGTTGDGGGLCSLTGGAGGVANGGAGGNFRFPGVGGSVGGGGGGGGGIGGTGDNPRGGDGGIGGGGGGGGTAASTSGNGDGGSGGFGGGGGGGGLRTPSSGRPGGTGGGGGFGGGGGGGGEGRNTLVGLDGAGGTGGFGGGSGASANLSYGGGAGGGAGLGGAIFNDAGGQISLTDCSLSANLAQGGNGGNGSNGTGATNFPGSRGGNGGSSYGGALFNLNGVATLTNCTLATNTVISGSGGTGGIGSGSAGDKNGCAIYNLQQSGGTAVVNLINTTPAGGTGCTAVFNNGGTVNTPPLCPGITLSPAALPSGRVNLAYNQLITASDGTAPYSFAVTNGILPGGISLSPSGMLSGTPSASGTFNFTVTVTDAISCTGIISYNLVINANSLPDAVNDTVTTNEDTAVTITVLTNDIDADNDLLSISSATIPANGNIAINGNGTITYTPNTNFNGTDSFGYTISDGNGGSDTATVTVNIVAVNDAPDAVNDSVMTAEDTAANITVLSNDTDVDGNTLSVTSVTQGSKGAVVNNANGTVTYTPNANLNGSDSFTYTIIDGNGGTATATVAISITSVNDAPIANNDSYSTNEDVTLMVAAPGVKANDTDVDGTPLTATLVAGPASGALALNADGSFSYEPVSNFFGTVSFTYKVNDGMVDSAVATATITIHPINDPPDAVNDAAATNQNAAVTISVLSNDTDIEGETLNITGVTPGANGTVFINANGTLTYTPNTNFSGSDSFSYTISDGHGGVDTAMVSITVILVNRPPTASAGGPYSVNEGGAILVTASGTDPDNGSLSYNWDLDGNGSFETPGQSVSFSAVGLDGPISRTIKVRVTDSDGLSTIAQTTVSVQNVAPTIGAINASIDPLPVGSNVVVNAQFTDAGIPDTHTAQWTWDDGAASSGTVTEANGSGSVTGNHLFTAPGIYEIKLQVTDDDGGVSEAVFQYVVVYDPQGGFVTGGGWIDSPLGAYLNNPALTGKANFGFVSKYLKGANVPTGNTEFQFKAGNLNFHSTSYDWLVVAGHKAQYKGSGKINNTGDYAFMLTATDGQQPGGGGIDKFRLKIWDKVTGQVIYDNKRGASDDIDNADPQAISGGSIVIHKE